MTSQSRLVFNMLFVFQVFRLMHGKQGSFQVGISISAISELGCRFRKINLEFINDSAGAVALLDQSYQDQIVFPDEAVFEKVPEIFKFFMYFLEELLEGFDFVEQFGLSIQILLLILFRVMQVGQSSGRVYLLKFKHDDRRSFFWMQVCTLNPHIFIL